MSTVTASLYNHHFASGLLSHQEHIPVLYVNIVPRIIHSVKYAETVDYHFLVELIMNFFKKALFPLGEDFFLEEDFIGLFDT